MKLANVLERKGGQAVTTQANATAADAIRLMYEAKVGSVLITAADGSLQGIFTERDVFHLCANGKGGELTQLRVGDCMTGNVICANPDDSVDDALAKMTKNRFRRIPVVVDGAILGVLSIGDLVKAKLEETVDEAVALRQYIAS